MACFERSSPALKEILLKLYRAQKPMEIEHHLYEFGSVEYHIQSSASDPQNTYLSISTPLLSQGLLMSSQLGLSHNLSKEGICCDVVDIVEPPKQGYQLTLRLDFAKIPNYSSKESEKVIAKISSVQAIIISSQLKEILKNVNYSQDTGFYKTIKLVYHPRESFFVIKQPRKITAVFPMRFKEDSDVIIATAFFQELVDIGSSEKWSKAPPCCWSPIPPPELRGELFEDLSTNGGFVSFEISSRHVEGKRLDKTVWSLLNFYAYVKHHVKSTKGFIQRKMRNRLEGLVQVLRAPKLEEKEDESNKPRDRRSAKRLVKLPKANIIKRGCGDLSKKVKGIRFRTKIQGLGRFRCRCLKRPSFSSSMRYTKLD